MTGSSIRVTGWLLLALMLVSTAVLSATPEDLVFLGIAPSGEEFALSLIEPAHESNRYIHKYGTEGLPAASRCVLHIVGADKHLNCRSVADAQTSVGYKQLPAGVEGRRDQASSAELEAFQEMLARQTAFSNKRSLGKPASVFLCEANCRPEFPTYFFEVHRSKQIVRRRVHAAK